MEQEKSAFSKAEDQDMREVPKGRCEGAMLGQYHATLGMLMSLVFVAFSSLTLGREEKSDFFQGEFPPCGWCQGVKRAMVGLACLF